MNCPVCGGDVALLGVLGDLAHVRCIDCGMDSSIVVGPSDLGTGASNPDAIIVPEEDA